MKLDVARNFAMGLLAACEMAEQEGRDEIGKTDTAIFSEMDDQARAELQAAIDAAKAN